MNRRRRRRRIQNLFVTRMALAYAEALRDNIRMSIGSDGESDSEFMPLGIWDKANFRTRGVSGGWVKADRTNKDKPLLDTGKLLKSIQIESVRMISASVTTTGRSGTGYRVVISAAPHGLEQARGGRFDEILLGRTRSIRESRNFGDLRQNYDYIVKRNVTVPARPWNNMSRTRIRNIARDVMQGITGANNASN